MSLGVSGCTWSGVIGVVADSEAEGSEASSLDVLSGGGQLSGSTGEETDALSQDDASTNATSGASGGGSSADSQGTSGDAGTDPRPVDDLGDSSELSVFGGGDLECPYKTPSTCDDTSDDFAAAIGLGCERGIQPSSVSLAGAPSSHGVHHGQLGGPSSPFTPKHGERFVLLSTGDVAHVAMSRDEIETATGCAADDALCPSTVHGPDYRYEILPSPINPSPVEGSDPCIKQPELVGTGDCSRTILEQWQAGAGELLAHDYTELRFTAEVPEAATHIKFSYAFLTAEYPARVDAGHNDLFIAWIESERWTGNFALDELANPIAVDVVRYDYRDAEHPDLCSDGMCVEPKLHGFGLEGHGATGWIERTAPILAGDEITLVFALFDLGDAAVDSVILLDGLRWDCALPG
ncbi:MAG: choice-of-anchor L domain-containing protein [Myxococcales bacterium]|nr:choice-of-anchor L domain-containing protein [Myxococcales bacterium]